MPGGAGQLQEVCAPLSWAPPRFDAAKGGGWGGGQPCFPLLVVCLPAQEEKGKRCAS